MTQSTSRRIAIAVLGNLAAPAVGFLSAPVLAVGLGVTGRGELGAAMAPQLLAVNMVTLGLPEALTYYVARNPAVLRWSLRRASLILALTGLSAWGVVALASPLLAPGQADLQALISLATAAIVPALSVALLRAVAQGLHLWWLVTAERTCGALIRLIWLLALWLTGNLDVVNALVGMSVTTFVGGFVYLGLLRHRSESVKSEAFEHPALLGFGMKMWAGSLTGILLSRLNQLLMTPFAGTAELGLFVVATSVAEVVLVFNGAVRDVTFAAESKSPDFGNLARAARISTLVTFLASVVVGVVSIWGLPLLFGRDFAPALPTLWVLLLANVAGNPGSVAGAGLSGRGRPGARSISMAIALAVNVIGLVALVPPLGALGAALAGLASSSTAGGLNAVWIRRLWGTPIRDFYGVRRSDFRDCWNMVRQLQSRLRSRSPKG